MYIRQIGNKNGESILFLHAIATSSWMWDSIAEAFPEFNCILVDLPGHGNSADQKWKSMADCSNELSEIIKLNSSTGKAHIVGLSFGSYVGLTLLLNHPKQVESAFLSGLNVLPLPNMWLMKLMGFLMLPFMKTKQFVRINSQALGIPAELFDKYYATVQQLNVKTYWKESKDAMLFSIPDSGSLQLSRVALVAGEKEHPLVIASLREVERHFSGVKGFVVESLGHGWSAENPTLFSTALRCWILGNELPPELKQVRMDVSTTP